MTATLAQAYVQLVPSLDGAGAAIDKSLGPVSKRSGAKAGKTMGSGMAASVGSSLKSLAGPIAALFAVQKLAQFAGDSLGEARESQKVSAVTEQIIKATGGAAKVTASAVGDLAASISNKTGIDDEAIQSGSNLLLTFKNVRNEIGKGSNIFDRATAAAVDLSKAGFGSVEGASKSLGKALNDPVKGIAALGRAGVTFTDGQKAQIKALVASGDTLKAQKIILKEVESQVGGVAAASATMDEKARVASDNLKESFGTVLLPAVDAVQRAFVEKIAPAIAGFVEGFKSGEGAGGTFRDVLVKVGSVLAATAGFIGANKDVLIPLVGALVSGAAAIKVVSIVTGLWTAAQGLLNVALAANPVGIVVVAIAALVAGIVLAYKNSETFRDIVADAFTVVKVGANALALVAVKAFRFLLGVWLSVAGGIVKGAAIALGWVPGLGPKLRGAAVRFEEFKTSANRALDKIENDLTVNVKTALAEKQARDLAKYFRDQNFTITAKVLTSQVYAGAGKTIPARAGGGPVSGGRTYLVGERGPELWTAPATGRIINARATAKIRAGMASSSGGSGPARISGYLEMRGGRAWVEGVVDGVTAAAREAF